MNKIVIPSGYMGSGSSAVTDLISEYQGYEASNGSFEYVFLHCPDGLFDLEDKLLIGNNSLRSDEALHSFWTAMWELYRRKLWWVGNYREKIGIDFMQITEEFIEDLTEFKPDFYWYEQEKLSPLIFLKMCLRKMVMLCSGNKVIPNRPLSYSPMRIAMPEPEEFYHKARKYLDRVLELLGISEKNLILDQLLLPFNLFRMEHYFGENAECFVVERDPRDVFISNKYVWKRMNNPIPYPADIHEFCSFYRKLRQLERRTDNPHVHVVHFEDLVYHYEEQVEKIEKLLGLEPKAHISPKKYFDPERSIQNTQLFQAKEYREETKVIEAELGGYLYDFPYERKVELGKVF